MYQETVSTNKEKILFVSHKEKQCGIYQYGINVINALKKSQRYSFVYVECSSSDELFNAVAIFDPAAIIYNYNPTTMPWISDETRNKIKIPQIGTIHEVNPKVAEGANRELFDYHITPDPTLVTNNPIVFKTGRLIPDYQNNYSLPSIPTIGSFGFATPDKGFEKLVLAVQEEFDEALIRLHIPYGDFAFADEKALVERCKKLILKPKIQLIATHNFLNNEELLNFLAQNTINVFLYGVGKDRGISSVTDYALAVGRPLAISNSNMFRHITNHKSFEAEISAFLENIDVEKIEELEEPKKFLTKARLYLKKKFYSLKYKAKLEKQWLWLKKITTLKQIIDRGGAPFERFRAEWSESNFVMDYERILDQILDKLPSGDISHSSHLLENEKILSTGVANVKTFNRILDNSAREHYREAIKHLSEFAPDTFARKIPEANIQQAFVLDTVLKLSCLFDKPKVLCIGSYEDTAADSLKKLGCQMEEVDPVINYDLSTFFHKESTAKESYDIIFSTSVLEHIRNDELFMTQIVQLLAPKGLVVLTFDFDDRYQIGDPIPPEDYRLYTQQDLRNRIFPLLQGCSLVGEPQWSCPNPDFVYAGKYKYTFATLVFQKSLG